MTKTADHHDIRWKQRFKNFISAFEKFKNAIEASQERELSELEKQGLIQAFEFTHELAWNVIRDYFRHQGAAELITGSRDATREAFNKGLIEDGNTWMEMIKSRNLTSHTYNKDIANEIVSKITTDYFPAFEKFKRKMTEFSKND